MKKVLPSLLFLAASLFLSSAMAQEKTVSGRVINAANKAIDAAVVVMFSADSTHLKTVVSNANGEFSMPLDTIPFQLFFEHVAFDRKRLTFHSPNIGEVMLKEKAVKMEEVVIKAYRPIVKAEEGKLNYQLSQIASGSTATNVYEALSKIPGVDEKDGSLSLAGMGALTVIINGKPSSMSPKQLETLLRSMPIDRVESAELMYSAPPKYRVRGAVLNLVLHRNKDNTYAGEVRGGYTHQIKNSWDGGASFAISSSKWSADAIYSYANSYNPQQLNLLSNHRLADKTQTIRQLSDVDSKDRTHTFRAALDYTPSDKHTLSIVYNGEIAPYSQALTDAKGSFVQSKSNREGDDAMHNTSVRYTNKHGFDIGSDYTSYRTTNQTHLNNVYTNTTNTTFDIASEQKISRLNLYADKEQQLNSKWDMSYGVSGIWAEDKTFQRYTSVKGEAETMDTESNLTEWTAEVYAGFKRKLPKGSLSVSLTGEYYNLGGKENLSLYPQMNFMWVFTPHHILQANLSSDKAYPSYWEKQQSIKYVDGYSELHGNPLLQPAQTYSSQLVYIHKQRYILALFFSQTNDYIMQSAYQAPDRLALLFQSLNWNYSRNYGANLILPFNIGKWFNTKASLVAFRLDQRCDKFYDISFDRSKWAGRISLDNTFQLSQKPNISLDLSAMYQSEAIQATYDVDAAWSVDAGLKLSLLESKLSITAKCSDLFESRIPIASINYKGQNLTMDNSAYTRLFSLNLVYRFGGYTKKERKTVETSRFGL